MAEEQDNTAVGSEASEVQQSEDMKAQQPGDTPLAEVTAAPTESATEGASATNSSTPATKPKAPKTSADPTPSPTSDEPQSGAPTRPTASGAQDASSTHPKQTKSTKAVISLVWGITAILMSWMPILGIILGIVAIVLAGQAVKATGKSGKAKAGKICGIAGIVLAVVWIVLVLAMGITSFFGFIEDFSDMTHPSPYKHVEKEDEDVAQAACDKLDTLKYKGFESTQAVGQLFDEYLAESSFCEENNIHLAALGIGEAELGTWMLKDFDYEIDSAYDYGGGKGIVFVNLKASQGFQFRMDATNAAMEAMRDTNNVDNDERMELAGEAFREVMTEDADPLLQEHYQHIDMIQKDDGTWQIAPASWEEILRWVVSW